MENTNNTSINVNVNNDLVKIRIPKGKKFIRLQLPTFYLFKEELISLFNPTLENISNICKSAIFNMEYALSDSIDTISKLKDCAVIIGISISITDNNNIMITIETDYEPMVFNLSSILLSKQNIIDLLSNDYNKTISVINEYVNTLNNNIEYIQLEIDRMNK